MWRRTGACLLLAASTFALDPAAALTSAPSAPKSRLPWGPTHPRRLERHVWRVQLNRLPKGAEIRPHVDQGSYVLGAHRLHIPLIVPRCVRFEQQRAENTGEGLLRGDRGPKVSPMLRKAQFDYCWDEPFTQRR